MAVSFVIDRMLFGPDRDMAFPVLSVPKTAVFDTSPDRLSASHSVGRGGVVVGRGGIFRVFHHTRCSFHVRDINAYVVDLDKFGKFDARSWAVVMILVLVD